MKLTFKQLMIATVAIVLFDLVYLWGGSSYGLGNWVSPKTLKFWAKDLAVVIGWILFLVKMWKK